MPRESSMKQLLGETVLFISMFALAGHLGINFWERYVIQSELSHMKSSLHSMKKTINNIGNAYDNLHKELKGLKEITDNHVTEDKSQPRNKYKELIHQCKTAHTLNPLNRKTRNDLQVHGVVTENNNKSCLTNCNDTDKYMSKKHVTLCNATTLTRYPAKSTKVGSESPAVEEKCRYIICDNKLRKCYKECDECQYSRNDW